MAMAGAGRRPLEWWEYETEVERPHDLGDAEIALFEMGELSEAEAAELMPRWRDRYEHAHSPNFSYCTGDTWLKGEEAKQRLYRWAGIPPAIVRKWDDERERARRSERPRGSGPAGLHRSPAFGRLLKVGPPDFHLIELGEAIQHASNRAVTADIFGIDRTHEAVRWAR
jgi:hypothetical protein